jgi:hypothetical protein
MDMFRRASGIGEDWPVVSLPLVAIVNHEWNLYVAVDKGDRIAMLGPTPMGSTRTIDGEYQLLAALRVLGGWMKDRQYMDWLRNWFMTSGWWISLHLGGALRAACCAPWGEPFPMHLASGPLAP